MNGYRLEELQNNNIWVIGNGESRASIDLEKLTDFKIGCNAIHRDYVCDSIVAVDRRMVAEILSNPDYLKIPIYTRKNWIEQFKQYQNVYEVPNLPYKGDSRWDDPWHWNSGPFAVLVASLYKPKTINLLGFDLYGIDQKINNIYKNTENYDKEDRRSIDNSHWLHQLKKLFDCFPNIEFVQWQKENWKIPNLWTDSKNLTIYTLNV